jgi:Zn finger protein HypA/HybF involved in hydrogenase expression
MMYKSPIELIIADIQNQIAKEQDEEIYKAVVSVGISVDKEELVKALEYDRKQYLMGYEDGEADVWESIVRCKDCKYYTAEKKRCDHQCLCWEVECYDLWLGTEPNDFCSYGERREGE